MSEYAVGIDLGGTSLKGALVKRGEGFVERTELPTEAAGGPDHILDRVAAITRQMARAAPEERIAGVGMGAPGAINWERTTVSYPPNLPGWKEVNVREALRRRLDLPEELPIFVENDANVAAFGSAHYGTGRPHDSFLMVTLGTGVGGAIIYRNSIFRGTTGAAGEFGHTSVDYEGPMARSGIAGELEAYLGQRFLSHQARYRLLSRDTMLHETAGDDLKDLTPKLLFEAAEAGDEPAREVWAWAGHKLGCALGSAVNLLDIRVVIVGGGVAAAGDLLLEPARAAMKRAVVSGLREGLRLIREPIGNDAGLLGAAHLVLQPAEQDAFGHGPAPASQTAPAERIST